MLSRSVVQLIYVTRRGSCGMWQVHAHGQLLHNTTWRFEADDDKPLIEKHMEISTENFWKFLSEQWTNSCACYLVFESRKLAKNFTRTSKWFRYLPTKIKLLRYHLHPDAHKNCSFQKSLSRIESSHVKSQDHFLLPLSVKWPL